MVRKNLNIKFLKDKELLEQTKNLIKDERYLLTKILHHLREVERRKLFSDLGFKSLFEYAVRELKYTEGQAGRRIQAMRLLKELPEIEEKIEKGEISLTNLSRAQSYFREVKKIQVKEKCKKVVDCNNDRAIKANDSFVNELDRSFKLKVLKSLENKTTREGEKVLLKLLPEKPMPKEKERVLSESHTEVKFIMSDELKSKLEEVKSLLGLCGLSLSFSELLREMTELSLEALKIKRFGKKRVIKAKIEAEALGVRPQPMGAERSGINETITPAPELQSSKNKNQAHLRYISKSMKHKVWSRDQGKCTNCQSQVNLNYDHIKPVAFGGESKAENLRLLCFHCNQREALKVFGIEQTEAFR